MTHRERALAAMNRKQSDFPAVQYYYSECGVYEHGEKMNDFLAQYPGDFEKFSRAEFTNPPETAFDENGKYYEKKPDAWGTVWEYLMVGRIGHAIEFPIKDEDGFETYKFPDLSPIITDAHVFEEEKNKVLKEKETHVAWRSDWCFNFLERLIALRGFENAMCDIYENSHQLNLFLDRLADYYIQAVYKFIEMGVDCIFFGDDYGTQQNLMISEEVFRKTIMPRLDRLMEPIRNAGIHIHFHSCGKVDELFNCFEELGVNSIWPQLPLYDMEELAKKCKQHKFALKIHTDRAVTMTHGTPEDVRKLVQKEIEIFKPQENGGWFYIEIDSGVPFENVEALVTEIYKYRV